MFRVSKFMVSSFYGFGTCCGACGCALVVSWRGSRQRADGEDRFRVKHGRWLTFPLHCVQRVIFTVGYLSQVVWCSGDGGVSVRFWFWVWFWLRSAMA